MLVGRGAPMVYLAALTILCWFLCFDAQAVMQLQRMLSTERASVECAEDWGEGERRYCWAWGSMSGSLWCELGALDNLHWDAIYVQQTVIRVCSPEVNNHLFCFSTFSDRLLVLHQPVNHWTSYLFPRFKKCTQTHSVCFSKLNISLFMYEFSCKQHEND